MSDAKNIIKDEMEMISMPINPPTQARIQKGGGGGRTFRRGGGGSYRNFRSGSKLLQGPGQINKQKKIADSRRGRSDHPPKNPVSAPATPPPPDEIILSYLASFSFEMIPYDRAVMGGGRHRPVATGGGRGGGGSAPPGKI